MLTIYYTGIDKKLSTEKFQKYLNELPEVLTISINKFKRWEDGHCSLFGKLLLQKGIADFSNKELSLNDLALNKYNRPFLNSNIDFNISHSGKYIVCALSDCTKVGVDIEKILPIDYMSFNKVFIPKELKEIKNSSRPLNKFYEYWTKKEAAIKADGRGMSIPLHIPLHNVEILNDLVKVDGQDWITKPVNIDKDYICTLALKEDKDPIQLEYIDFN
jgi:4'-phosphopantetheinyl transferase